MEIELLHVFTALVVPVSLLFALGPHLAVNSTSKRCSDQIEVSHLDFLLLCLLWSLGVFGLVLGVMSQPDDRHAEGVGLESISSVIVPTPR